MRPSRKGGCVPFKDNAPAIPVNFAVMSYIALGDAYGVTATIPAGNPKADAESWELYWRAGDDEQPAPPVGSSDGWQGPVDPDGDGDFSADWLD